MAFDLTGSWRSDDGGHYILRQIDNMLWWLGTSSDGVFNPGLTFCNVYRGTIIEQGITGNWSDVPRGVTANHGELDIFLIDGKPDEQELRVTFASGGFGGTRWQRTSSAPVLRPTAQYLAYTLKNVTTVGGDNETLADNLSLVRDSASVFATVLGNEDHAGQAVVGNYSAARGRDYASFICGGDGDGDGDVTFKFSVDIQQVYAHQPNFYGGAAVSAAEQARSKIVHPVEAEIIMFGRAAGCDDPEKLRAQPLFPGWAEPAGNAVLFNGRPIRVIFLPPGVGSNQPNFLDALKEGNYVRVTGPLVFDIGHEGGLEIHPVYSVDLITARQSDNLSGTWADDVGNTYYLRHHAEDNSVWFGGLSPLGVARFGQVFYGSLDPGAGTVHGDVAALSFGFNREFPPSGFSYSSLGDTGHLTFQLDRKATLMQAANFRLIKLYDAPAGGVTL